MVSVIVPIQLLSGCPRKNRPLNFDQIFDFLQTFSARQGWYKINENTFRLLVIFLRPEILRQMLLTPGALKIALSSIRNWPILGSLLPTVYFSKKSNFYTSNTYVMLLKKCVGKSLNYRDLFK